MQKQNCWEDSGLPFWLLVPEVLEVQEALVVLVERVAVELEEQVDAVAPGVLVAEVVVAGVAGLLSLLLLSSLLLPVLVLVLVQ